MTEDEKIACLGEHLPCELLMLRYALEKIRTAEIQLDLNMAYENFALHARNLRDFLTNEGGKNNLGVEARHIVKTFKVARSDQGIDKVFNRLTRQENSD